MTQTAAPPSSRTPSAEPASRAEPRARGRAWPRWLLAIGIALLLLVVLVRVLLDPIAAHFTRQALAEAEGMEGRFSDVHVSVFPPGYQIRELAIIETPGGDWERPLFEVERAAVSVYWRRLVRGQIATELRLDEPHIKVTQHSEAPKEVEEEVEKRKPRDANDVARKLEALVPARVERLEVRRGAFSFRDADSAKHPEVNLSRLELAVENIATRPELTRGRPATASLSAMLGKSGDLSGFVSADLFAESLNIAGNVALRGWKVAELYELEKAHTQLQTPTGTLDMFAEFKVENGRISGGVKPVLKNVEVRPAEEGLGTKIKAWVADTALDLFEDEKRDAVATVVPIQGHIDDPQAQVVPTVLSIVRNAFVQGIASGFAHLPPPQSEEKEGILSQAADALTKENGPAEAQPEGGGKK